MRIAIASGKGGAGKTLVSTNLFNLLKQEEISVELIDCDAEEPNDRQFITGRLTDEEVITQSVPSIDNETCTFCGKCQEYCQYNAIIVLPEQRHIQVIEELCHDCGACTYACQFNAIIEKDKPIGTITRYETAGGFSLTEGQVDIGIYSSVSLINKAIKCSSTAEWVLLDAPPGTSCPFIATVSAADYVILVSEPTPFGLNDLRLSVDTLKELGKPFGAIINRSGLGDQNMYNYLRDNGIHLLAEIPFDRLIAEDYSEGRLITDTMPAYTELFKQLFHRIKKHVQND